MVVFIALALYLIVLALPLNRLKYGQKIISKLLDQGIIVGLGEMMAMSTLAGIL